MKKAGNFLTVVKFRAISFFLVLLIIIGTSMTFFPGKAYADDKEILRVGYYPLKGFFEYDAAGNECGYGVDVLNEISKFSKYKFEYVKLDSWEQGGDYIKQGKIDIRMPASMPAQTSTKYRYSEHSIIDTYYALMTTSDRDDLLYEDYDNFEGLKIAISESLYNTNALSEYLEDYSISKDSLVFCDTYDDSLALLEAGKVDALISNIMDYDSDSMKILEKFHTVSNYIAMPIDDDRIYDISEAIAKIKIENPTFFADIYKKYYPERTVTPLTANEEKYLKSLGELDFVFWDGQGYLCEKENGEFVGILPSMAKLICSKLGVAYKAVEVPNSDWSGTLNENHPYIFPKVAFNGDFTDQRSELSKTDPYMNMDYSQVYRKDSPDNLITGIVAVPKNYYFVTNYVEKIYPEERVLYCDSFEECLDAVRDKKADSTIMNNYIAEYYLLKYKYNRLNQRLTSFSNPVSLGILNDNNFLLTSAFNKTFDSITDKEWNDLIIENTSMHPNQDIVEAFVYDRPELAVGAAIGLSAIILVLIFMLVFTLYTRKKNKELVEVTAAKSNFMSRMSHDLRTPMSTIMGITALARDKADDPDAILKMLSQINESSKFILGLVNDSLDLDKISSGKMELVISDYPYVDFYNSMKTMIEPLCKEKNITFVITDPKEVPYIVRNDKLRVEQIFFNLLSNAVKFTPNGGKIELLSENCMAENGEATVDCIVRDNGIGMSAEFQRKMFEPFTQEYSEVSAQSTGSGLGLSIVKKLVDLMGATMTVKSAPGEGSEFRIHFKLQEGSEITTARQSQTLNKENDLEYDEAISILKGKHILLAEDHPINLEIAKKLLEKGEMIVSTAMTGKEALDKFVSSEVGFFDAILMDIRMPVMDGIEASKEIRGSKRTDSGTVPIIAMTANAFESDIKETSDAGMNAHLTKPVDTKLLFLTLSKYIKEKNNA